MTKNLNEKRMDFKGSRRTHPEREQSDALPWFFKGQASSLMKSNPKIHKNTLQKREVDSKG